MAKDLDPREPRRMAAWLTLKGKQVVSQLLETVNVAGCPDGKLGGEHCGS